MLERGVREEEENVEGGAKGGGKEETSFSLAGLITLSIYFFLSCRSESSNY